MLSRRKLKKFCHKGPPLPILPAYTSHEITYEYTQSCMVKWGAYHQSFGSVINEPWGKMAKF